MRFLGISLVLGGLLCCGMVCGQNGTRSEEPFQEGRDDIDDPYFQKAGARMTPKEIEACTNLQLEKLKEGVYFGSLRTTWRKAHECCELKGLSLLSHPERHADVLPSVIPDMPGLNWLPWIGANDILTEGIYEWPTGENVPVSRPPFREGEPNNYENNENCGQTDREGLLNDGFCNTLLTFLCEDTPPSIGEKPTDEELEFCKTVEYEIHASGYKKQKDGFPNNEVNRPLAKACCASRGWRLASFINVSLVDENDLAELLGPLGVPFWTSGLLNETSMEFKWESKKQILHNNLSLWSTNYPQSLINGRRCVQVTRQTRNSVSLRHVSCNLKASILCEDYSNDCCEATDTATFISVPGPNRFEFRSPVTTTEKMEIGLSLTRHLSPSETTNLDWTVIWETYFFLQPAKDFVEFDPIFLSTPQQDKSCITRFFAYIEYVATCNKIVVAYINPVIVTAVNVSHLCVTPDNCIPSPCVACDCWILAETHYTLEIDTAAAASMTRDEEISDKSCFDFVPPLDKSDFTNALLAKEFVETLSPSPSTGVNWREYYFNVTSNVEPDEIFVQRGEVPRGNFLNVYKVQGTCGQYKTTLPVYKKVLFKTDDVNGNCEIARDENVPLDGC